MNRLLYALALGLVGAALLHVAGRLALPVLAADNAWRRLERALPPDAPRPAAGLPVAQADPLFRVVLCRFDLRRGPMLVTSAGRSPFWSAAVFAPEGQVVASVSSGMTGSEAPNLRILRPDDAGKAEADRLFPLVAEAGEALLALRFSVPDESWAPLADALAASVRCGSAETSQ